MRNFSKFLHKLFFSQESFQSAASQLTPPVKDGFFLFFSSLVVFLEEFFLFYLHRSEGEHQMKHRVHKPSSQYSRETQPAVVCSSRRRRWFGVLTVRLVTGGRRSSAHTSPRSQPGEWAVVRSGKLGREKERVVAKIGDEKRDAAVGKREKWEICI